ncbi:MAG: MerR family transcriptional regulator [Acidimicrobiia bacterium]|nr:MerR family transcriptional regulator [Acidimicrobiia bacterium]
MDLTVGQIARLAGVSVRTLHHYDELGLVQPAGRTPAGYRLYDRGGVRRLQEVLFFRELGFGLDEIRELMEEPEYQRRTALQRQRSLLEAQAHRTAAMIEAIERALDAEEEGEEMTDEELLGVFGDFDPAAYEQEAQERWGDTAQYRQSATRTAAYSADDWETISAEVGGIYQEFVQLLEAGVDPSDETAAAAVDRHREHISRWYYECTPEIHAGLGHMYVADERFTRTIDATADGLAAYLSAAIAARYRS